MKLLFDQNLSRWDLIVRTIRKYGILRAPTLMFWLRRMWIIST